MRSMRALVLCGLLAAAHAAAADDATDSGLPSVDFRGFVDGRLIAADAERNWLDGDLGKTRYGRGDNGAPQLRLAEAALIVLPRFSWSTSGMVYLKADPEQDYAVDLVEGYLAYRPVSTRNLRLQARAGVFYPPISLENDGIAWTSPYSLTYSAINTWVGEELRVLGAEARVERNGDRHDFAVTAALTANNDNAGTVLYRRGWALHDFKPGINDRIPLPPLPGRPPGSGPPLIDEPFLEIDERLGYYTGLSWRYDKRHSARVLYYDNRADPAADEGDQSAWLTQLYAVGVQLEPARDVTLLAQYMIGDTILDIGFADVKVDFESAYVLVSRQFGKHRVTLRGDWFEVRDVDNIGADLGERGWAALAAYAYAVTPKQRLFLELLDLRSERAARGVATGDPDAHDVQAQIGYRLFF